MKSIEMTGRTVEEAISAALQELQLEKTMWIFRF